VLAGESAQIRAPAFAGSGCCRKQHGRGGSGFCDLHTGVELRLTPGGWCLRARLGQASANPHSRHDCPSAGAPQQLGQPAASARCRRPRQTAGHHCRPHHGEAQGCLRVTYRPASSFSPGADCSVNPIPLGVVQATGEPALRKNLTLEQLSAEADSIIMSMRSQSATGPLGSAAAAHSPAPPS